VFFLHIDPETDRVTLGVIHDNPATGDGGGVSEFYFSGYIRENTVEESIPLSITNVIVKDDPSKYDYPSGNDKTDAVPGKENTFNFWRKWNDSKTDGGMISLGTTWDEFCIETWPGPLQGKTHKKGKITQWIFKNAAGIDHEGEYVPDSSITFDMGLESSGERENLKLTIYFKPRLIPKTPANEADLEPQFPIIFTWRKFSEIATYELKLCEDLALSVNCQDVIPTPTTNTSTSLNTPLASGDYYWRVKATKIGEPDQFIESDIFSFTVQSP